MSELTEDIIGTTLISSEVELSEHLQLAVESNEEVEVEDIYSVKFEKLSDFLAQYGISASRRRKKNILALSEMAFESYKLGVIIASCCKKMDLDTAFQAYCDAKSQGIIPSLDTYANLLNLTAGFGEQGSSSGPLRDTDPPSNMDAAYRVYSDMKESSIKMNEASHTAIIRCLSLNGKVHDAMTIYRDMIALNIQPKNRTYTWLLHTLSSLGDIETCFELYQDILYKFNLIMTERDYVAVLRVCVHLNDERFYDVLHTMMEDVFVPQNEVWDVVGEWFQRKGFEVVTSTVTEDGIVEVNGEQLLSIDIDDVTRVELLKQIELLSTENIEAHQMITERSLIESSVGAALEDTDSTLRKSDGESNEFAHNKKNKADDTSLQNTVDVTAVSGHENSEMETMNGAQESSKRNCSHDTNLSTTYPPEVSKGNDFTNDQLEPSTHRSDPKSETSRKRRRRGMNQSQEKMNAKKLKWSSFKRWLVKVIATQEKNGETDEDINTILFDYRPNLQIKSCPLDLSFGGRIYDVIVDGANVGYYKQNFVGAPSHIDYHQVDWLLRQLQWLGYSPLLILHCRHLFEDVIPTHDDSHHIIQRWQQEKIVYASPGGANDDWFWLYAAVVLRCHIVSNDEMRDHHFLMLSPRWFSRWKERHQIHFSFGPWDIKPDPNKRYDHYDANNDESRLQSTPTEKSLHQTSATGDKIITEHESSDVTTNNLRWRKPLLSFPKLYSNRMQRIPQSHFSHDEKHPFDYYIPLVSSELWLCAYRKR